MGECKRGGCDHEQAQGGRGESRELNDTHMSQVKGNTGRDGLRGGKLYTTKG